jgi:hypothetical protein
VESKTNEKSSPQKEFAIMNEILVLSNPRSRHKKKGHRRASGHRRHTRRNPIMGFSLKSGIDQVKDGALGAVGGLLNDAAYGYAKGYLPASLQDGYGRIGAKLGLAVLVGILANKLMPGKGRAIAVGAATVVLHEAGKALINQQAPSIPLGAYEDNALLGYDSASILQPGSSSGAMAGVGSYMRTGAYMPSAALNGVGDMLPP